MSAPLPFATYRYGATKPGPHLLISAGVHGDEYLPMLAVKELIQRLETNTEFRNQIRGTLTLIPIVNRPAFQRGHRCGEDEKDLARSCPGRSDGSPTEQIAAALSREIESADFYVDLHTGGTESCVLPLTGYVLHSDEAILTRQRKLAQAFQLPFVWGTSGNLPGRSLSVARDAGVPAIYIEYLGAHRELSEVAAGTICSSGEQHPLVSGCLNVMRHLGILEEDESRSVETEVIEDWRLDSGHMQICHPAPSTGFLIPQVSLGDSVARGDTLALIVSESGRDSRTVLAENNGKIVVLREYPRVNEGNSVAVIAESHPA